MDYFLLRQSGSIQIPKEKRHLKGEPSIRIMENVASLEQFDYLAAEALISNRLKLLFEQYLLEQDWQPCSFVEPQKEAEKTFWFLPPLSYQPEQVTFASNGLPCSVLVKEEDIAGKSPGIFYLPNPKGSPFVIIHLSVAESILRCGYCGLELNRF